MGVRSLALCSLIQKLTVCDDDNGYASCETGFIRIARLHYGQKLNDGRSCNDIAMTYSPADTRCRGPDIDVRLRQLRDTCRYERVCRIMVNSTQLGEIECPSVASYISWRPYVVIEYYCSAASWCQNKVDHHGTKWALKPAGSMDRQPCPYMAEGSARRKCIADDDGDGRWWSPDYSACVRRQFKTLSENTVTLIDSGSAYVASDVLEETLTLSEIDLKLSGDLVAITKAMSAMLDYWRSNNLRPSEDFITITSNLLQEENAKLFHNLEELGEGTSKLLMAVGEYSRSLVNSLAPGEQSLTTSSNIVVHAEVQSSDQLHGYIFPANSGDTTSSYERKDNVPSWLADAGTNVNLTAETLRLYADGQTGIKIFSVFYKNVQDIVNQWETDRLVNSLVTEVSVESVGGKTSPSQTLKPPVRLTFQHQYEWDNTSKPECCFWDFNLPAVACTVIAVLLHYLYLVVFCAMLASGVHLYIIINSITQQTMRIVHYLVIASWVTPVVIVTISLAATQSEGYGSATYCWLSIHNMLILAFIIPVGVVVCVNVLLLVLVFRTMFQSRSVQKKSNVEKAGTALRSLCVLIPLLGLTWTFGFFAIYDTTLVFQYLFAIFGSVQGVFIFVFHCVLNKQVREAISQRWRQYRTVARFRRGTDVQRTGVTNLRGSEPSNARFKTSNALSSESAETDSRFATTMTDASASENLPPVKKPIVGKVVKVESPFAVSYVLVEQGSTAGDTKSTDANSK
ncbi:PREDICTED: uncharacterized protein LOC106809807 [Priapulus caudatus]|uniref:Uncharacterized protein LOC106809807 n=1 Tax=Priapulus caudatus TaxID=37621 RepID=A0ABM1E8I0_PRICU|nr:PREDICTED: uncharacterized protein LOC106809807 [Priapulus caudatus]